MNSWLFRSIRLTSVGFGQRQRIHVGAQQKPPSWAAASQDPNHARLANTAAHIINADRAQSVGDQTGGPMLLVRQPRVPMEVAPPVKQEPALLGGPHGPSRL